MSIKQMFCEQIPALISGLLGSIISLWFGGNIKGGFKGAIENTLVTVFLTGIVTWYVLGWWFEDSLSTRISASVGLAIISYPVFIGIVRLARLFSKYPLDVLDKLKK